MNNISDAAAVKDMGMSEQSDIKKTDHTIDNKVDTSCYLPSTPWFKFIMVCCIFALWGIAGSLNDILIAQFKKGFALSDLQCALVQSVFFFGYFVFAIPAAIVVKKFSYQITIVIGLSLYAIGCFLFIPASSMMTYGAFLACLGVIAAGLSFLETSCNTYSSLMGPISSSTQRINFSQIFNSVGVFSGIFIGQQLVFRKTDASLEELSEMAPELAAIARHDLLSQVVYPYLVMGVCLVVIAIIFLVMRFPKCKPDSDVVGAKVDVIPAIKRLLSIPHFTMGVLSQFLYVGAQVGLWSFTIRFVQLIEKGTSEHTGANWLMATIICYSLGKVVTTALMRKFEPSKLLGIFCACNVLLIGFAVINTSMMSVYAIMVANFCMSLCWPTNFGLCIKGLGKDTQFGGSLVIMAISGGAVVPLIMGLMSDLNGGNMQFAFIVPLLCFAYVSFFGFYCHKRGL